MRIERLFPHKKWKMRHVCGFRNIELASARYYKYSLHYGYCTRDDCHYRGKCISTKGRRYDEHSVVTVDTIMRHPLTRWCHHYQGKTEDR